MMTEEPDLIRGQVAALERDFPGWHFIAMSDTGRIWAQRNGLRRAADRHGVLVADTCRELRALLMEAGQ